MSASVAPTETRKEREELKLRLDAMRSLDSILGKEIRRLQERQRVLGHSDLFQGQPPLPKAPTMAAEPPAEGQEKQGRFPDKTPGGKPLKESGATAILKILAKAREEELAAQAAKEAKKILPPWHGMEPPRPQQMSAHDRNAEALARITARMAEELANLVTRFVAWMRNPPPFATYPAPAEAPERRPAPSLGPSMQPGSF